MYVLNSRKGYRLSEKYCRSKQTCFRRFRVHGLASCLYQSLVAYAFGVVVNQAATDILKYTLGRLRPHFLDVCQPNWNSLNCTGPLGIMRYVTEDMCSTVNSHLLKDARLVTVCLSSFCVYTHVPYTKCTYMTAKLQLFYLLRKYKPGDLSVTLHSKHGPVLCTGFCIVTCVVW